ncbi:MAG TPA: MFS transporter [Trebonia sp.]
MIRLSMPRALSPLRHGPFRLLVTGQVASNLGDACYAVALPWYVLAGHGGTVLLGTVLAAYGIPRTAAIPVGGYLSDRWRPQAVMLATDALRALAVAALALTAAAGPARAAELVPIAVVLGAGEGLFLPASFSVIPALLPGDDLQAGNALASGGTQLATLVGPAFGGVLVALASPALAFGLDAVSFAVSAATLIVLIRLRATPTPTASSPGATAERPDGAVQRGPGLGTLLRAERVLLVIMVVNVAANLGSGGLDGVAIPALAHGPLHASATGYGTILAAFGGGALVGTIAAGQVGRARRPAVTGGFAFLAEAAFIAVTPFMGGTAAVAAAVTLIGVCNGFGNVVTVTAFQQWAPEGMLGRLVGLLMVTSFGVYPVSVALAAAADRSLGTASFFLFAAGVLALAVLGGLTQRSWRDFGTGEPLAADARDQVPVAGPDAPTATR